MKYNKYCPKCSSTNLLVISNDGHPDGTYGNNIMCGLTILANVVMVKRYICCDCGYTEEWIDGADMQKIIDSKKSREV